MTPRAYARAAAQRLQRRVHALWPSDSTQRAATAVACTTQRCVMRSRTYSWVKTGEDALQSAGVARHLAALPHPTDNDATRQRATRRTPSEHADGEGGVSRRACRGRAKSKASQSVACAHPARCGGLQDARGTTAAGTRVVCGVGRSLLA